MMGATMLVRAGVPQTVAMKITGHKTDSVFRRYDVVSAGDLRNAAQLLDKSGRLRAGERTLNSPAI